MRTAIDIDTVHPRRRVTVTLPAGVYESLATLARRSGLHASDVVEEALRRFPPLLTEIRATDQDVAA